MFAAPAVQAYVDGFVSEISQYYSAYSPGVYANVASIKADISQLNPLPAAIWTAAGNTQATVWNQGFSDSLWPNGQRMHQFILDPTGALNAKWGGTSLGIDYDVNNGPVVNANTFSKSYSYTPSNIDCAGALNSFPSASTT